MIGAGGMTRATLAGLTTALATGRTTARALVEESLARIADPAGEGARAFISVKSELARAEADFADAQRRAGRAPSPFAGIPFGVKDLFDLAGDTTTAGSRVLKDAALAVADAVAIARLRAKGFIVIGRNTMTEFAYSGVGLNPHYGTPRAPFDRATGRIPGGSSSGAGVAVADGLVSLAIGSDTGGSCRIPASYCGVTGYKPSHGLVPLTGTYPLSFSFDTIGPLANSVACCAAAHAIMADDVVAPVTPRAPGTLRLAVLRDFVLDGLEPAVEQSFQRALKMLGQAGAGLSDLAFPELKDIPAINAKGGIVAAEAFQHHRARMAAVGDAYDPRVRSRMQLAEGILAADYLDYFESRRAMIALFAARSTGFDAVILPTTLNTAPPIAALTADQDYLRYNAMSLRNTYVGNFLNGCAISIPMQAQGEAPCGLMLMAPWGRDRALLDVAAGVEAVLAER
jgi:aspartyl-tRNA(Asn)/glutamyl-tRNA(Gln) amidotransferase subunit A